MIQKLGESWCRRRESNPHPCFQGLDFESSALTSVDVQNGRQKTNIKTVIIFYNELSAREFYLLYHPV